uniref:GATA-type domain-containing protein n=1 Tax=Opuntia streptacantha TaxID=393608 RepID=A0A7C8YGR9_OPUST
MDALDRAACFMEELLDFASDIGEEEEADDETSEKTKNSFTSSSSFSILPEFEEEELEWISNKDAFPMVESFVDIIPNHPSIASTTTTTTTTTATTTTNHHSPVSVLETSCGSSSGSSHGGGSAMVSLSSNFKVPGKARSKQLRKRRRDMLGEQWHSWGSQEKTHKPNSRPSSKPSSTIGRKCLHCQAEKTPQWRAGPYGPKTLCNACGVRYKSGRLVPEYRPASSPTFSSELHSNSHRKIMEMRKQKIVMPGSEAEAKPKPKEEIG